MNRQKHMKMMALGLLGALVMTAAPARSEAAAIPELVRALGEEMDAADGAVAAGAALTAPEDAWLFRRFLLRVRPKVAIGIAGFLKLEIAPEAEMQWERDLPTGWVTYKP
jgi:hypothetical protein